MPEPPKRYKREFFLPAGSQAMTDEELREVYDVNDPLGKWLYDQATKPGAHPGFSIPTREDELFPWGDVYDEVMDDDWREDRPEAQHWTSDELHEALSIGIGLAPEIIIPLIQKYGPDFGFEPDDYDDDNKEQVLLAMDEIIAADKPKFLAELRGLAAVIPSITTPDIRLTSKTMTMTRRRNDPKISE
ncbi:MAG TPA: hypothetical protein VI913_00595 [Candidatus Peribacteraceae bacterium]|nr:hypothetical protein [Candidatus Peribacteraceae bacterium]